MPLIAQKKRRLEKEIATKKKRMSSVVVHFCSFIYIFHENEMK